MTTARVIHGDSREVLKTFPDNHFSSVVCDPPYSLVSITKRFGGANAAPVNNAGTKAGRGSDPYARSARGFLGKTWDGTGIEKDPSFWAEVLRVLKPGGFLLAFGGTRTSHRLVCAIEDAGFEIRDSIGYGASAWVYACLSEDTEILTEDGWEQYHKITTRQRAMGYNVDSQSYEWMPIEEVFVYDYRDTAYRLYSDYTDQLVSRNHRCLVERGGMQVFEEAQELEHEERVPVLEDLPGLLKALPVRGQSGGGEAGDLLGVVQRSIRQDAAGVRVNGSETAREHQVRPAVDQDVPGVQEAFPLRDTLSSEPQEDVWGCLCGKSHFSGERRDWRKDAAQSGSHGYPESRSRSQAAQTASMDRQELSGVRDNVSPSERLVQAGQNFGLLQEVQWETQGGGGAGTQQTSPSEVVCRAQGGGGSENARAGQSCLEGRRDDFQEARQLCGCEVCALSEGVLADGSQGWVCHGTPTVGGSDFGALPLKDGSCASQESRSDRQCFGESATVSEQSSTQTARASRFTRADLVTVTPVHYVGKVWCIRVRSGAFVARRNGRVFVTGNSGFPKSHNLPGGIGTALKPSWEPICMARKPLIGTVAQNVAAFGTGGLNIDASRVRMQDGETLHAPQSDPTKRSGEVGGDLGISRATVEDFQAAQRASIERTQTMGRWPANTIFSPEAAAELDRQSGQLSSGTAVRTTSGGNTFGGNTPKPALPDMGYADSGGASRFFFVAKPSSAERECGMDGFEKRKAGAMSGRETRPDRPTNHPERGNTNPCVKPQTLLRYLCRLVTPPGGTVLDPFAGSGSAGIAAVNEGFGYVGIEMEQEYFEIAEARLAHAQGRTGLFK